MSIELRITTEGLCECGIPHQNGYEPGCRHDIQCDWGTFGDPTLIVTHYDTNTITIENAAPLILVAKTFADRGTAESIPEGVSSFYTENGRRFMRFEATNGTWTWELFEAHWSDGHPNNVYVGRWPD